MQIKNELIIINIIIIIIIFDYYFYLRSGDVTELQPKAIGSSFLLKLTTSLIKNLLNNIGMNFIKSLIILPFATGMALTLSFLTLKASKPVR